LSYREEQTAKYLRASLAKVKAEFGPYIPLLFKQFDRAYIGSYRIGNGMIVKQPFFIHERVLVASQEFWIDGLADVAVEDVEQILLQTLRSFAYKFAWDSVGDERALEIFGELFCALDEVQDYPSITPASITAFLRDEDKDEVGDDLRNRLYEFNFVVTEVDLLFLSNLFYDQEADRVSQSDRPAQIDEAL